MRQRVKWAQPEFSHSVFVERSKMTASSGSSRDRGHCALGFLLLRAQAQMWADTVGHKLLLWESVFELEVL